MTEGFEDFAEAFPCRVDAPLVGLAQQGLQFVEHHLNRSEIGAVGRQEGQMGAGIADGVARRLALVAAEIVEDDDIAGARLGSVGRKTDKTLVVTCSENELASLPCPDPHQFRQPSRATEAGNRQWLRRPHRNSPTAARALPKSKPSVCTASGGPSGPNVLDFSAASCSRVRGHQFGDDGTQAALTQASSKLAIAGCGSGNSTISTSLSWRLMIAAVRAGRGTGRPSRSDAIEMRLDLRRKGAPSLEALEDIKITDVGPIVRTLNGAPDEAELVQQRWSWPRPNKRPVCNFRSEGREFNSNRCLIIADGFYEFTEPKDPRQKRKDKCLFTMKDEPIFCIAGFWRETPEVGQAFTMLTMDPGPDIAPYHDRGSGVRGSAGSTRAFLRSR